MGRTTFSLPRAGAALCLAAFALQAQAAPPTAAQQQAAEARAQELARELRAHCPLADAADQAAFDRCRAHLFGPSRLKQSLAPVILWGRQAKDVATPLKDTNLTQFAPDVWAGLYAPIFMYDGSARVDWVEGEGLFRVKLGAAFRNRLPPGQFPYPFWHDGAKWGAYENANGLLLWLAPDARTVKVAQFTWADGPLPGVAVQPARHAFDGRWLWTDAQGRTQPAVTLFDGLFSAANPHKAQLEQDYRALAVRLRDAQCFSCHVPDNPDRMKRLVLLQTPAHAAGEITRLLRAVRENRMPLDEAGIEQPLPEHLRRPLLEQGAAFEATVQAARRWEAAAGRAAE